MVSTGNGELGMFYLSFHTPPSYVGSEGILGRQLVWHFVFLDLIGAGHLEAGC